MFAGGKGSVTEQYKEKLGAVLWREAIRAFKDRRYDHAAELLLELLDHGADFAPVPRYKVHEQAGVTLLRLRRTDEGVGCLEKAVELQPQSGRSNYKLGLGYGRQRRDEMALQSFEKACAIEPENVDYLARLAQQYARMQDLDGEARARERIAQLEAMGRTEGSVSS